MRDWSGQPVRWAEQKMDGFRCTIHKRSSDDIVAVGQDEQIDLWPKLRMSISVSEQIEEVPDDSIIDCEIFGNVPASSVPTLLNDGTAEICPFALPRFRGEDYRMHGPSWINNLIRHWFHHAPDWMEVPGSFDEEHLLHLARERKWEGWVLKNGSYSEWYKLKPVKTIDVVVYDWKLGNGKYATKLGAILVGVYRDGVLVPLGSAGSGFEDHDREDCNVVGRVAELEYDSVAAKGKLRFPRFLRWRTDKLPHQCSVEQLEG